MSTKAFKEVKNLSKDELTNLLRETRQGMFKSKIELATGQLKDTSTIWRARKKLARIQTRLTQLASGLK